MTDPYKRSKRKPRPINAERLERMAVHYLGRYPASIARFRMVMKRKLHRAIVSEPEDVDLFGEWLARAEEKCLGMGLLDDDAYARGMARSLHRQGLALRAIKQRLRQKGLEAQTIEDALETLNPDGQMDIDLIAAVAFARKKRLGPWAKDEERRERYRRHLGAMARRGFGFGLARKVLDGDANELEEMVEGQVDHW
mgnify:CR=1 FL=1